MKLYCQSCGWQHTDHLTEASITYCPRCGGSHFKNVPPPRLSLNVAIDGVVVGRL